MGLLPLVKGVDGRWEPGIGDPSLVGWITVAAYFSAALLCYRAHQRASGHDPYAAVDNKVAWVWMGLALALGALGVNKQLDLQSLLTQVGDMDETVVAWDEGRAFTLRLHKGDAPARPFREATFRYALEPTGETCEIVTCMEYTLAGGVLGRLLDVLAVRRVMQGNVRDVGLALAEHYRTDAPVLPERLKALRRDAGR